jgi:putative ABC transport system permease protein
MLRTLDDALQYWRYDVEMEFDKLERIEQIVLVEGVLIGLLSWLLGALIAIPLSMVLSNVVGELILEDALTYTLSLGGALLWLGIVILLAALASYLPARSASRLTVREVLAYE